MAHEHDDHGHGHGHGGSRFIQHHYDDAQHQFDSGKLGIWIFLAQEILFFSALFVAYIVYRANHPEVFAYAHKYLDTNMGAINTGVLILSSLTAAWAVRAAQLSQKKILVFMLAVTIVCACGFLVVKYFEYSHKAHIGTLFGTHFKPSESPDGTSLKVDDDKGVETVPDAPASKVAVTPPETAGPEIKDGIAPPQPTGPLVRTGEPPEEPSHYSGAPPPNTAMFFTIYFAMTGLHGLHVAIGILVFIWLLWRAIKGHFTPDYFGPVDYAALYWHLVDLIWIYLFPLLYLIH
jgi:cytochrome c oxidase subunit 3